MLLVVSFTALQRGGRNGYAHGSDTGDRTLCGIACADWQREPAIDNDDPVEQQIECLRCMRVRDARRSADGATKR